MGSPGERSPCHCHQARKLTCVYNTTIRTEGLERGHRNIGFIKGTSQYWVYKRDIAILCL